MLLKILLQTALLLPALILRLALLMDAFFRKVQSNVMA